MNEVLRFITQRCCLCENSFDLHVQQTYGKQMSLFVTQGDSLRFHLLPQFYHPVPPPPPSLPAFPPPSSLGGHFLPVSTSPGWGVWSEPLQLSLSPFSLSLSRSQSVFPFSCSLSVDSPLSHRSGLHYLPSSPSSKMTFSDFTKARHFDSVKSPQSRGEGEKKETCVMSDVTG